MICGCIVLKSQIIIETANSLRWGNLIFSHGSNGSAKSILEIHETAHDRCFHRMGMGDGSCRACSRSASEVLRGGREDKLRVELDRRRSLMVTRAATAFLKRKLWPGTEVEEYGALFLSISGNVDSIVASHSFSSLEMRSVAKNGCTSTLDMYGGLRRSPLRLSYFFKIFVRPVRMMMAMMIMETMILMRMATTKDGHFL